MEAVHRNELEENCENDTIYNPTYSNLSISYFDAC